MNCGYEIFISTMSKASCSPRQTSEETETFLVLSWFFYLPGFTGLNERLLTYFTVIWKTARVARFSVIWFTVKTAVWEKKMMLCSLCFKGVDIKCDGSNKKKNNLKLAVSCLRSSLPRNTIKARGGSSELIKQRFKFCLVFGHLVHTRSLCLPTAVNLLIFTSSTSDDD